MQCVYPWYTVDDGRPYSDDTSCTDHSDQIFEVGLTCRQHLQKHLDFHHESFCNENYWEVQSEPICTDISQWLLGRDLSFQDPHNCQSSCRERGPDCLACSNSSYFFCDQSSKCIHPSLVCDGHPQCLDQSDEDQCPTPTPTPTPNQTPTPTPNSNSKSKLVLDVSSALFLVFFIRFTIY